MGASPDLLLATTGGGRLFSGAVEGAAVPAFTVALMVVLAVAATRSRPGAGDPGATELSVSADLAGGGLRFESLAPGAAGALHARLDLPLRSLRVDRWVAGSAGLAASDPLRASLKRRRPTSELPLRIGDGEEPTDPVRPPLTVAPGLEPVATLSRGQATSLLRMLPRGGADSTVWALPTARSLLLGAAAHPEAVGVPGAARLTVLRPLVRHATGLRVLSSMLGSPGAASAWQLTTPGLSLTITVNGARPGPAAQPWMLANTTTLSR